MKNSYLLFVAKGIRSTIFGFLGVSFVIYMHLHGFDPVFIGITLFLLLISSAIINYIFTALYPPEKLKNILLFFSIILVVSLGALTYNILLGIIFGIFGNMVVVTGQDGTLFTSIEQPIIAADVPGQKEKNIFFGYYTVLGYVAAAIGSLFLIFFSVSFSFNFIFILSLFLPVTYLFLSPVKRDVKKPILSQDGKVVVKKMSMLFGMDAFAGGFILQSLISYWFYTRFEVSLSSLGSIFFVANIITGVSIILSPVIANRIGLVRTMVFTHLPSSIFLILIPVFPVMWISVAFLFLRQSLSQMDVPARNSYINSILEPSDRVAGNGITNFYRTASSSVAPVLSAYLIGVAASGIPFFAGGGLKIAYDLLFLKNFKDKDILLK